MIDEKQPVPLSWLAAFKRYWQPWAAYSVLLLFAWLYLMPWRPGMSYGLDYAWSLMLQVAHAQGLQFGRDVIFTYGCWGFVETGTYYPATRSLVLGLNAAILILWTGSIWLATGTWMARNPWLRMLTLLMVIVASLAIGPWFTLSSTLAMVIIACPRSAGWGVHRTGLVKQRLGQGGAISRWGFVLGWVGLMVLAGIVSHMKISYNAMMVIAVGTMTLGLVIRWPRRLVYWVLPLVYLLSWLGAWLAMGQSLWALPEYLAAAKHIVGTYGHTMDYPGPWWQGPELMMAALWAWAVIAWGVWPRHRGRSNGRAIATALRLGGALCLMFVVYKSGMIRQGDGHFTLVAGGIMGISWVGGAAYVRATARRRRWQLGVSLVVCLVGAVVLASVHGNSPWVQAKRAWRIGLQSYGVDWLVDGDRAQSRQWAEQVVDVQKHIPIPQDDQTTDLYPTRLDIPVWLGLKMHTRPVFQSYVAADDYLMGLNAARLAGRQSPQRVLLMDEEPIDNHYANYFDSLSWPWLLTRYQVTKKVGAIWVLERHDPPRSYSLTPLSLSSETVTMGQRLKVPLIFPSKPLPSQTKQGRGIWVQIDLKPTLWGRLRETLYKPPYMIMELIYANGSLTQFKLLPDLARSGFLLSPEVSIADWGRFAVRPEDEDYFGSKQITSIRIFPMEPWTIPAYQDQIDIAFEDFKFEPQPLPK